MDIEQTIKQLNVIWEKDVAALKRATEAIRKIEKIKVVIHNATCPNYYGEYTMSPEDVLEAIERIVYEVEP
jgi:hypothetical protein